MKNLATPVVLLLALGAALPAGRAGATVLTRHPSLWKVTTSSILIAWQTDVAVPGKVLYGLTPALGSEATDGLTTTNHGVTLTGLASLTRYYYRIVAGPDTLTAGDDTLHTAPPGPAPFRFVAFGDCGVDDANQYAVAARVDALNPDLGLVLGDVIYEVGEAVNFTPRYFTPYRPIIRRSVWYPVVGNHDIATANGQPFMDAFYLPTNSMDGTEKYYSFDYGNAHFVALDGNQTFNADMYTWVEADLAATTKPWKFVYFHQPMYSDPGVHGSDLNLRFYLEPIFVNHRVDLVFQGHNHYYSRSYPIANGVAVDTAQGSSYRDPAGVIYLVAGGGGRGLYAVTGTDPLIRSAFSVFHTLAVDVVGDSVSVQAVLPNGTVFDSFSIVKSIATAVEVVNFTASSEKEGIRLRWRATGTSDARGFNLYRGISEASAIQRINDAGPIVGGPDYSFLDRDVQPDRAYFYKIAALDDSGHETWLGTAQAIAGRPVLLSVRRPRPNPFDRQAELTFTLPRPARVHLTINDVRGRRVRELLSQYLPAGEHGARWDGRDDRGRRAASGIYFATLEADGIVLKSRLALLR
ncbi:MAG TPA: metallophosphoesterase [Candidatus Limnocylindrales bacterium]|nr:metallophosphoesterase [Candidatus Limnocylindrales bacterium]